MTGSAKGQTSLHFGEYGLQALEPAPVDAQASPPIEQEAKGDLPAWLVPTAKETEDDSLARAEIPEWLLALKPTELRDEGEEEDLSALVLEPTDETGLLAGLRGTLPVEMIIAQPRAVAAAEPPPDSPQETPQSRLFAEIVARGPELAAKAMPQPRQSRLAGLPLWLIYLALLGAVTLPLLLQNPLFERSLEPSAALLDLYDGIEALDPGLPVLVAFDYDPSSSDEMNVLARAVVGHLFERGIRVVAVTLQPAGFQVAQSLLEEVAAGQPGARYVLGSKEVILDWSKFELAFDGDSQVNIYRNRNVLPRAYGSSAVGV